MNGENIYKFDHTDEAMDRASADVRKTFKFFWRELSWEYRRIVPALDLTAVKIEFQNYNPREGEPSAEHMWINDIQFNGENISGTLLNEPQWIDTVSAGDSASAKLSEIGDWMYACQDEVFGAYTVNLMRSRMGRAERNQHDAAWGLEFGDPHDIRVVPSTNRAAGGFLKRLFGKREPSLSLDELARTEHPMSENMKEKIAEGLAQQPSAATDLDDEGWSILHRESLAGNRAPVQCLLKYGADRSAKTPAGETALDLAKKMDWPNIVELLGTI